MKVSLTQIGTHGEYEVRSFDVTEGLETIAVVTIKIKQPHLSKVKDLEGVIKKEFEK